MFYYAFKCFTYCLVSKLIGEYLTSKLTYLGLKNMVTTPKDHCKSPWVVPDPWKQASKKVQTTPHHQRPFGQSTSYRIWSRSTTLSRGSLYPIVESLNKTKDLKDGLLASRLSVSSNRWLTLALFYRCLGKVEGVLWNSPHVLIK